MKWFPILVLGAVTLTACATEDNLLQNADFTQKTLKGGIAAWRIVPQVGAQAKNGILRVVIDNPSRHKDKFSASVWRSCVESARGNMNSAAVIAATWKISTLFCVHIQKKIKS